MLQKKYHQWAPLFLRLIIGYGFMVHGWAKLSRGPSGFEKLLEQIGIPFSHFFSWAVSLTELLGGLAIFIGVFVNIIAVPLICTMLVAMFSIHLKNGFSSVKTIGLSAQGPVFAQPGYEIDLLYIAGLIAIILTGAGIYSVDYILLKRKIKNSLKKDNPTENYLV